MPDPSRITVLVVDDDAAGRYAMSRVLRRAGFEVAEAGTGRDALHMAASAPDLIILDVKLPDVSGFEVCRRLKADPATSSIMVLQTSATYVRSEDRTEGLETGADGYLPGPVEPAELLATVKALLRLRLAEREVRESARQWQATFDAISDGVALLDAEGRVVRGNQALGRLLARPARDVIGLASHDLVPGGAGEPAGSLFARMRETRRREAMHLSAGGRWFHVAADPVLDEGGALTGAVCIVSDITEQKRVEEALRESEARLRRLVDSNIIGVITADMNGIREANDVFLEMVGYTREDLAEGRLDWRAMTPPEYGEMDERALTEIRTSGVCTPFEKVYVGKDGRRVPILLGAAALSDARDRWICFVVDLTDRKRAENGLRFLAEASTQLAASLEYEATLATIARLAVPALADYCIIDLLAADRSRFAVASAHVDPVKAELVREMVRRFPPDPKTVHPLARALETGQPELVPEAGALLADVVGRPEHLEILRKLGPRSCMVVPLVARGQTLGVISLVSAESGRRYGPADLALAAEMARRAAVAIDNARLYQEVQEAVRARDQFLARAAHDLRTPLTSAIGTVRLLGRALSGTLNEPPGVLVDIASRNLTAMLALTNDLLDASKLAAGRAALALEPVEVAVSVREAFEITGALARDKGVALRAAVPVGLTLRADRVKLEQVLVNLLANAVKFTPAGGEVIVEAEAEGGHALIRVRDTGEGIAREHLEQVFEPFFQASAAAARPAADRRVGRARGTGLGLAICRQIVTLHGGRVWAESEGPGRGSTFTIRIPLGSAEGQAA